MEEKIRGRKSFRGGLTPCCHMCDFTTTLLILYYVRTTIVRRTWCNFYFMYDLL